ncbi:MAG: O-antigen ligase family protein [Planctomycetes bacterium]|nr:O-antigen ligase family protein [Planctomycetota bacterium]
MSKKKARRTSSVAEPVAVAAAPSVPRMPLSFIGLMAITVLMPMLASYIQVGGAGGFPGTQALLWMGALIVMTFSVALLEAVRRRSLSIHPSWAILGVVLLSAGAGVAAASASDRYGAVMGAVEVALGALYFLTCLMVIDGCEKVRWLLAALVAGAFVTAASAVLGRTMLQNTLLDYFMAYRLEILTDLGIRPDSPEEQMYRTRMAGDVFGTFYHPNLMANYVAMGGLAALALLVGHARKLFIRQADGKPKSVAVAASIVLSVVLVVMVIAVWLAKSRAGAAAAVAGVYVMVVLAAVRRRGLRVALIVGPAAVAAIALGIAWHMDLAPEALKSLRFRWDYWQGAWGVIRDYPLRGVGAENFGTHYLVHKLPHAPEEIKDPHNIFIRAWSEFGLLGLFGVVTLLVAAARESLRRPRDLREPRWPMAAMWRPMIAAGVCIVVIGAVFRGLGLLNEGAAYVAYETVVSLLLMTGAFIGAVGAGLEDDASLADRSNRWLRCGILGALVVFILQGQVSFNFSELPTATAAYLLVALVVATAERRDPVTISLEPRGRRVLVAAGVLALMLFYGGALLVPVSESLDELAAARRIGRMKTVEGYDGIASLRYREALRRAAEACPKWLQWTEPSERAAEGFWHAALFDCFRVTTLRQRAASLDDSNESDERKRLLDEADRIEQRARASFNATRTLYGKVLKTNPMDVQTWYALTHAYASLADNFPDVDVRADALAAWQHVVDLYPTRAPWRCDFARFLERSGRHDQAAEQARMALDLDDKMPDPLRKLPDEDRRTCLRLTGHSSSNSE